MYTIKNTGQETESFAVAVKMAQAIDSQVIEKKTGIVRWEPAPAISNKKMRVYRERLAAHEAYKKSLK